MVLNLGWQNFNTNIPMVINKMNSRERSRVRPRKIQDKTFHKDLLTIEETIKHLERFQQSKCFDCNILQSRISSLDPLHGTAASMTSALHRYAYCASV